MELYKKVRDYRIRNKIKQEELAKTIGITVATLSRLENNKHKPNSLTKAKIERVLENENIPFKSYFVSFEVMRDERLSDADKTLYGVIATHCYHFGDCNLTNEELAKELNYIPSVVARALQKLVETGYVAIKNVKQKRIIKLKRC